MDSQLTKLHLHFASTQSLTFVRLVSSQLKINVGRRGTNQLRLLERYLDVLVIHTTEIPPPGCLSRKRIVKMIYFKLEYLISLNQIHAHTCYQLHRGNGSQNLQRLSDFLQRLSDFPQRLQNPQQLFAFQEIYLRQEVYKKSLFELCIFCHSLSHSRSELRNTRYNTQHIFQAQIMDLMASLEFVRAYMDDLLIITRITLDKHLQKMETVLTRLRDARLKVNAAKSSFCAHEIEYLDYILPREGIKPQPKKVQAILALNPPNNVMELRHFLGIVQYYRDMWARRSEMLAPLTDLVEECGETKTTRINKTKKKPWQWDSIHQQAFNDVKAAIAKETVLAYLDFLKPFEIYTDASSMQLGAVITQDNRPIAFFSRKLSETQQKIQCHRY